MDRSDVEQGEIAREQEFVDRVYARLDVAADTARGLVAEGMARGHIGHEGGLVERDAMVHQASRRLSALDAAHDGLVFGRLDLRQDGPRYIGRIGVRDANHDVMLIDWRAPAAAVFYQATAQNPAGVVRRRVLRSFIDRIIGIEDELLDAEAAPEDLMIIGEGALLASLSRARDTRMHSVVATIQAEQDDAIRAPARGATIISGGPGTGKTVVALHRAAYLLYTDRRRFESGGVLIVGPSGVFMGYIDRVLPSLGETSVTLRSIGAVVDGITADRHDPAALAAVKGAGVMIEVLRRLAEAPLPDAPTALSLFYRDDMLRLKGKDLRRLRRRLLGMGRRNAVVPKVAGLLIDELRTRVRGPRALERTPEEFAEDIADNADFQAFVEAWWPVVNPVELWASLPDRLAEIANDVLTPDQIVLWQSHAGQPSIEDVPLIDELRHILGEVSFSREPGEAQPRQLMSFERADREQPRATSSIEDDGYAHVLVDEAQDLSPMQWRMLGRRGRVASWTIVGDLAQSSWPDPEQSVAARREALGNKPVHAFQLTKNYRNSAEIYELAAAVAQHAIAQPDLADAVRRTGVEPVHHVVVSEAIATTTQKSVESLLAEVSGTVAIVATGETLAWANGEFAEHPEERLSVLDPLATKGLEFDAVLLLEADEIVAEADSGWRTLYVVLTRATQQLVTIQSTDRWLQDLACAD